MEAVAEPSARLGDKGLIARAEYVRLLQQSLLGLGYAEVASLLEQVGGAYAAQGRASPRGVP
jgi:hypothetical protein